MNWSTSIRNSTGDMALEIDLYDQWEQLKEDHIGLHLLASSYLHDQPSNTMTQRIHQSFGIRRRVA